MTSILSQSLKYRIFLFTFRKNYGYSRHQTLQLLIIAQSNYAIRPLYVLNIHVRGKWYYSYIEVEGQVVCEVS